VSEEGSGTRSASSLVRLRARVTRAPREIVRAVATRGARVSGTTRRSGWGRVRKRNAREKTRETHHLSLASRSASTRARLAMGRDGTARRRALSTERPEGNWRGTVTVGLFGVEKPKIVHSPIKSCSALHSHKPGVRRGLNDFPPRVERHPAPHEGAVARVRLPPAARGMGKRTTAAAKATTGPLSGVDVRFCLVRAARCPI